MAAKIDPVARQLHSHIETVKALMRDLDRLLSTLRAEYDHLKSPILLGPDFEAQPPA